MRNTPRLTALRYLCALGCVAGCDALQVERSATSPTPGIAQEEEFSESGDFDIPVPGDSEEETPAEDETSCDYTELGLCSHVIRRAIPLECLDLGNACSTGHCMFAAKFKYDYELYLECVQRSCPQEADKGSAQCHQLWYAETVECMQDTPCESWEEVCSANFQGREDFMATCSS